MTNMTQQNTGSQALFRENAVKHQQQRLQGEVLVLPRVSTIILTSVLTIWTVLVVLLLIFGQYARNETVQGWLEPSGGLAKHYVVQDRAMVKQVLVQNGEYVEQGQTVLTMTTRTNRENGGVVEQQLLNKLLQQASAIQAQISTQQNIHKANLSALKTQLRNGEIAATQIEVQQTLLNERERLLQTRFERAQNMQTKGFIAQHDIDQIKSLQLTLLDDKQTLFRQHTAQQNEISTLMQRLDVLPQEHQNRIHQLTHQLGDIEQRIMRLDAQHSHTVVATQSGTVSNLHLQVGQYVNPQHPVFTVVPQGSQLIAKMLVPVRAIGFVEPQQSLDIRYDAFPFQKFGLHKGTLTAVSSTVVLPNEMTDIPVAIREPMYLIQAQIAQQHIDAYGDVVQLKTGMTFNADIQLEQRSLIEWLFEPLISLKGRL